MLLHGGGQTRHSWAAAVRELAACGYLVVNYDARGHGDSGWSADHQYPLAALAADLHCVSAAIRGPVAWVGASLGGLTSLKAAVVGPPPAALVLVDIVLQPERSGVDRIRNFMSANPGGFAGLEEAAEAIASYNPHRRRPKSAAGLMKNLRLGPDGRYRWHWDPGVMWGEPEVMFEEMARVAEALRAAPAIPCLLVRGAASDVVSDASVEQFRGVMPEVEVFDVNGAGHMVAGDSNEAFNAAIVEFLARRFAIE